MVADPAAIFAGAFQDAGSTVSREEKAAKAQDISGLVKHKKKPTTSSLAANANGKRGSEALEAEANSKRPKTET